MKEAFELLAVGLENLWFRATTEAADLMRYGTHLWWWQLRFQLGRRYWWDSPYAIVRREGHDTRRTADELIWGETPCGTLDHMFHQLGIRSDDVFCDLGCGRGMTVLFAHLGFGLESRGYEIFPGFVSKARAVTRSLRLASPGVEWRTEDFLGADLSECTVVLAAWTTFPDDVRGAASRVLETLPEGARVATLTHPLTSPDFRLLAQDRLRFSWGYGTVYYYLKTHSKFNPAQDQGLEPSAAADSPTADGHQA